MLKKICNKLLTVFDSIELLIAVNLVIIIGSLLIMIKP